jgi:hypothetical protein
MPSVYVYSYIWVSLSKAETVAGMFGIWEFMHYRPVPSAYEQSYTQNSSLLGDPTKEKQNANFLENGYNYFLQFSVIYENHL